MINDESEYNDMEWDFAVEEGEGISEGIDPKLHDLAEAAQIERETGPTAMEADALDVEKQVVEVLAELVDPSQAVPGLKIRQVIAGTFVTAELDLIAIESVRAHPNVVRLEASKPLSIDLDASVFEMQATPDQIKDVLPPDTPQFDGEEIIIGIIDYGCDFVHHNFRHEDDSTRLLYLWDQRGGRDVLSPNDFGYGREFDAAAINQALNTDIPYQTLNYDPGEKSHGTHVMDIAAGNGRATGHAGVAPKADLIFVHASTTYDISQSLGSSVRLLEAVLYIFNKAQGRPIVINISLGTQGGPHDGTTLFERSVDRELLSTPGRAIVMSAGNSRERFSHAGGEIEVGSEHQLAWQITQDDPTDNECEIWYAADRRLDVSLIAPGGKRLAAVPLGSTDWKLKRVLDDGSKVVVGRIIHQRANLPNETNHIDILLDESVEGEWGIALRNVGAERVSFHAWIERDNKRRSQFAPQDDVRSHTIGSISCSKMVIAVGSYDPRSSTRSLSPFSAEGPTRDNRPKPEVSAPGHGIVAACSRSQGTTVKSGTSMASPHVTGLVALMMQAAKRPLPISDIRQLLFNHMRKNPPAASGWHPRYGFGRVSGEVVQALHPEPVA